MLFFVSSRRRATVRKLLMHAVPRRRLRSSLSVVQRLFCRLVCFFSTRSWLFSEGVRGRAGACGCGHVGAGVSRRGCDHVLASGWCLSRDESASKKRTWHTLFPSVNSIKIMSCVMRRNPQGEEEPSAHRSFVGMGVRVSGCVGVCCFFLFILVCLSLFQQHAAQYRKHWSQHEMFGTLRRLSSVF